MATILVVDDEPDIRTVMSMLLPLDGHVVVTAADGVDALEIVATTPIDLVFTDWRMPRMGGLELCRRLRTDGEACAIPILVSSAAMAEPPGRGELYDAFLPKPAAYADQMQAIERLLRERK
jgi:CheY-like chemotaxis protein